MKAIKSGLAVVLAIFTGIIAFGQGVQVQAKLPMDNVKNNRMQVFRSAYTVSQADLEGKFNYSADSIVRIFKFDETQNKVGMYEYTVSGNKKSALSLKMEEYLDPSGQVIRRKYFGSEYKDVVFEYNSNGDEIKDVVNGSETIITDYDYENGFTRTMTKYNLSNGKKVMLSRIDYEYDDLGRKDKQFMYDGNASLEKIISFSYDASSKLIHEEEMDLGGHSSYADENVRIAEISFEYEAANGMIKETFEGFTQNPETIVYRFEL